MNRLVLILILALAVAYAAAGTAGLQRPPGGMVRVQAQSEEGVARRPGMVRLARAPAPPVRGSAPTLR